MTHGPTALVLAQGAEDDQLLPARIFAPFRHALYTPACQGRAGANSNGVRSTSFLRPIARSSWP